MKKRTPAPAGTDTAAEQGAPLRSRLARGAWRRLHRNRRHLPPLAASLVLAGYGQALTNAPHGVIGAIAADAALPAAVFAARAWRAKKPYTGRTAKFLHRHRALPAPPDRPMRRAELVRTSAAATACGLLLTAMPITHTGPFEVPMTGWWWLALTPATAIPWWWRRRIRATTETAPLGQEERIARWAEKVGASRGALPGSTLVDPVDTGEGAWEAVIELDGGRQTTATAISATTMIASAYGLPISSIAVDGVPGGAADKAKLLVYDKNPLKKVPVFPGPEALDVKTGIARLGLHIDGGPAQYQMWRPGWGAVHTHISGATGSGKSALLRSLFAIERHSGLVTSWGGDPQEGKSFGFWQDYLSYFAPGVDECMGMLIAADAELTRRSKASALTVWYDEDGDLMFGDTDWSPTPEEPLISVTIDEWQDVWGNYPEALDYAVRIAILGRKVGIKLRLVTHLPTLDSLGTPKLRQPLTAGNNIAFRTTERSAGYVINLPADPNDIPAVWPDEPGVPTSGMGYLKGVEERAAMFRGWSPERSGIATRWAKRGTPAVVSAEAAEEIGPLYTEWRDRLAARRRGELPAVPGVTDEPQEETADAKPAGKGKPQKKGSGAGTVAAAKVSFDKLSAPAVSFDQLVTTTVTTGSTPARGDKKKAILAFLEREEQATTGIIAAQLKMPLSTVSSTLKRAAEKGEVIDLGHGAWGSLTALAAA
ncbi:helix-turn-helix domain-containing protein [Kitasatospora sp. NBC_01302]|uniref:helix-turn-helix domain-containing protein n=1 Tax=Kitasatospora sp. NBC_01302 TaxID=2903575 RepID=UPI002E11631A|nr:hypothetical protein OG294_40035 [Kitasatospora sp. NBC_01302]